MGDRLRVEKAVHGKHVAHLGPPSEVREARIRALKPFKVAEFTFQGEVPSAAYKSWQERMEARAKSQVDPVWKDFLDYAGPLIEEMHSMILLPSNYSPRK